MSENPSSTFRSDDTTRMVLSATPLYADSYEQTFKQSKHKNKYIFLSLFSLFSLFILLGLICIIAYYLTEYIYSLILYLGIIFLIIGMVMNILTYFWY